MKPQHSWTIKGVREDGTPFEVWVDAHEVVFNDNINNTVRVDHVQLGFCPDTVVEVIDHGENMGDGWAKTRHERWCGICKSEEKL